MSETLKKLVHEDWKPQESLVTGLDVKTTLRGHIETYRASANVGGETVEQTFTLTPAGQIIRVSPDVEPHSG